MGDVEYADQRRELYWYDFHRDLEPFVDRLGTPWLAALLPLAVTLREPLTISAPVDPVLLRNAHELMAIWSSWYSELRPIAIHADAADATPSAGKCVAYFSGGIDSFFSILRRQPEIALAAATAHAKESIDDLLCIWGIDIPIEHAAEFGRLRARLTEAAAAMGHRLLDVATNLRRTRVAETDWRWLSHGCGLASVGLVFGPRFGTLVLGSTYGYRDLRPWGSHPLTDPLLSTSTTQLIHDGGEATRIEKTCLIARSEVAMKHLLVCWKYESDVNCSNCNKCYRTMMALHLIGALKSCPAFDASEFDIAKIKRIYSEGGPVRAFYREVHDFALACERPDVAAAIRQSFRRSDRIDRLLEISKWLFSLPYVWRLSGPIRKYALAGAII
jgi:hypothetical protein